MYVATNRIKVAKPHGAELEERFGPRGGVEKQPGFLGFELWRSDKEMDHEEYLVVTHWESPEAYDGWIHSESFRQAHAGMRLKFILGPGELGNYQVVLASQPETG